MSPTRMKLISDSRSFGRPSYTTDCLSSKIYIGVRQHAIVTLLKMGSESSQKTECLTVRRKMGCRMKVIFCGKMENVFFYFFLFIYSFFSLLSLMINYDSGKWKHNRNSNDRKINIFSSLLTLKKIFLTSFFNGKS